MWVYIGVTFFSWLLAKCFQRKTNDRLSGNQINKLWKILVVFLPIFVVTIFRWNMAPDTNWLYGSYPNYYRRIAYGGAITLSGDPLFYIPFALLAKLKIPFWWVLTALGCIYICAFAVFIKKYSCSPSSSILLYTALGLLSFPFGALRQALAESILLIAYGLMIEAGKGDNKYFFKKVLPVLLVGGFIHGSVMALIPIFFVAQKAYSPKVLLATVTALCASIPIFGPIIVRVLSIYSRFNDAYASERTSNFTISFVILAFVMVAAMAPEYGRIQAFYQKKPFLINMLLLFMVGMLYSSYLVDPYRVIHLFTPTALIMLPMAIKMNSKITNRVLMSSGLVIVFLIYFVRTNIEVEYQSVFPFLSSVITAV